MNPSDPWLFHQPRNTAVITVRQILEKEEAIGVVYHDEDDHGWQFLGRAHAEEKDARIVSLESMVKLDPTIGEIADLPPGWSASRSEAGGPWARYKNPDSKPDDPFGLDRGVTPTSPMGSVFQLFGRRIKKWWTNC